MSQHRNKAFRLDSSFDTHEMRVLFSDKRKYLDENIAKTKRAW